MLSRLFVHFMILMLFAVGQIGIASHALEHIQPQIVATSDADQQTDDHSKELCLQCVAKSQAEQSDLPTAVVLSISKTQADLLSITFYKLSSFFSEPYSARAPPKYS